MGARGSAGNWRGDLVAFAGLLLLGGVVGGITLATPLDVGDALVLLHALMGALHVLVVSRVAQRTDPFVLNAQQLTVLLVIGAPVALAVNGVAPLAAVDGRVMLAFAYLAVLSTVVASSARSPGSAMPRRRPRQ